MRTMSTLRAAGIAALVSVSGALPALASEADLKVPDLNSVKFLGVGGHTLLTAGLLIAVLGLVFGFIVYKQLKALPFTVDASRPSGMDEEGEEDRFVAVGE